MGVGSYASLAGDELERQFNPRHAVPDHGRYAEERRRASAAARQKFRCVRNLSFGPSARQAVDIFVPERPSGVVQIYFHGGYWRAMSKDEFHFVAEAFAPSGIITVVVGYDLCPEVTLGDIVRQSRAAIAWVFRNIVHHGGDPSRLHLSGTSAGGQLAVMAVAEDWAGREGLPSDLVKSVATMSGVLDLAPVLRLSINDAVGLTPELAEALSPMRHLPLPGALLLVAVGADETAAWIKMTECFVASCRSRGLDCRYLSIAGANHYSLTMQLADPASELARAIRKQMGV